MLTLLHISDLHITTDGAGGQFDRDLIIRQAMLDDLGKDNRSNFDAILVTGDIAYHGRADEYVRAKRWLEELRTKCSSDPEAIFVVPGNHDVNQAKVSKHSSVWELHQTLRTNRPDEERLASLQAKLKDPALDFLIALKEYCDFAQGYGCPTSVGQLAWLQFLDDEKKLEDGTAVRFHGLNSALISDAEDEKANLLLADFQFSQFKNDPSYVDIVLCHHPHSWLLDGNRANDYFRTQSHIVLCGHEHDARCYKEGASLRIFAGAIHPNRRESRWQPCYHVIRLSIDLSNGRDLIIQVETRDWANNEKCFVRHVYPNDANVYTDCIRLSPWRKPIEKGGSQFNPNRDNATVSSSTMNASITTADAFAAARRKLIVHFFRIGTLSRFEAAFDAGVWDDSDDALDGQARWARVFDRAEKDNKLGALWDAVAKKDSTLSGQINPFTKG